MNFQEDYYEELEEYRELYGTDSCDTLSGEDKEIWWDSYFNDDSIDWDSLSKDEYCKTLLDKYQQEDYNFDRYNYKDMFRKYESKDYIYNSDESVIRLYESLPNELTVYRGGTSQDGISWTLNKDVAKYFARRNNGDIFERRIKKEDIKAIILAMDEEEIILTN